MSQQPRLTTREINFTAKFPCRRADLARFLRAIDESGHNLSAVIEKVGHGRNFYSGFRGWAVACQLCEPTTLALTPLASRLLKYDPELSQPGSAWILHGILCSTNPFWQWLFAHFLRGGTTIARDSVVTALSDAGLVLTPGLYPYIQTILASYYRPDAFGVLGILVRGGSQQLHATWLQEPPPAVYAWALYRYVVEHTGGQSQEVSLSACLSDPGSPCVSFFPNERRAEAALQDLSQAGLVTVRRYAYPYTLAVEVPDEDALWPVIYQ